MHKLGIVDIAKKSPLHSDASCCVASSHASMNSNNRIRYCAELTEPLKYNADRKAAREKSGNSLFPHSTTSISDLPLTTAVRNKPKRGGITFNDTVTVLPIPMRSEYSERVKHRIWSSRMEIHENAARNKIEFAADGWDWRNVTEDNTMYVCSQTGELVHPVHYHSFIRRVPFLQLSRNPSHQWTVNNQ